MKLAALLIVTAVAIGALTDAAALTFNVTGSNSSGDTLTGTLEADAVLTNVTVVNLLVTGPGPVQDGLRDTVISYASPILRASGPAPSSNMEVYLSFAGGPTLSEIIALVFATYDPSLLCGVGDPICHDIISTQRNAALIATATLAQTPIPGALPLFASGLAGLGLVAHRKRRRQACIPGHQAALKLTK